MISTFKIVSYLEGISFLLILFVTMPLKYFLDMPEANKTIGMAHGLLFVAYVCLTIMVKNSKDWDYKTLGIVLICSIIPFGTFWMDKKYM
ncbi:DUF3817 domain-containing protein [Aquimarina sp. W85]|uniref:DUF3817 domain-containing protein n=1 Tax=Aquimarina rhodophyticola TaxID=3342246 RepID=UPI0036703230